MKYVKTDLDFRADIFCCSISKYPGVSIRPYICSGMINCQWKQHFCFWYLQNQRKEMDRMIREIKISKNYETADEQDENKNDETNSQKLFSSLHILQQIDEQNNRAIAV